MAAYYIDASALVKRYVREEPGSAIINAILDDAPINTVHMAAIGETEVVAAISRRGRSGLGLTVEAEATLAWCAREAASRWVTVEITATLIRRANVLARRHFLRGYDAVHLAAALTTARVLQDRDMSLTFVCSDARLNGAANAEGLDVFDPTS